MAFCVVVELEVEEEVVAHGVLCCGRRADDDLKGVVELEVEEELVAHGVLYCGRRGDDDLKDPPKAVPILATAF